MRCWSRRLMLSQRLANSDCRISPRALGFKSDHGSGLVEVIGMLGLVALITVAIFEISLTVHVGNELTHAAAIAARAGAISGQSVAHVRLERLLDGPFQQEMGEIEIAGLCVFEVKVTKAIKGVMGERKVVGIAHATCEA